ncbi:uncharacterized protein CFAP92 [Microcaecilia unicolor]|uniref:Uncharacterized protein KIAA1257 homolog n=1 Tax=Microcaecilia unicolor TaxID=1415580 RepID=A0A6P7YFJ9_9AMPH|nr:uncharacterized protein KIAA1257 homolog [Microcaecilia unicolor]XP_030063807.1 uncharacterized protein KIAA1257 homolog [Microcaecilia unicolor]XP_030063808.1 uncharacterized protein KIAA1257 homolog [Microcaecilia unicolor]
MSSEGIPKNGGSDSGFTTDGGDNSEPQGDPSAPGKRRSKNEEEPSLKESSELPQGDYISIQEDDKPDSIRDLHMSGMSEQEEKSDIYSESDNLMEDESFERIAEEAEEQEPFHLVTLTLTVGFSVSDAGKQEQTGGKRRRSKSSAVAAASSKTGGYYHIECTLLPDGAGPVQADVVMTSVAARLFTENNEPQILKPWHNGERVWLAWSHNIELKVTKAFLLNISSHVVTVNIWDNKDKTSTRTKLDKPKPSKMSTHETENSQEGEIQGLVTTHRKLFEDSQPKPSFISCTSADVHHLKGEGRNKISDVNENVALQERNENLPAAFENVLLEADKKEGKVTFQLDFLPLLAGDKSVTQWVEVRSFSLTDAFITLAVNVPLISEEQKLELNPLIIRIISATSLPTTPISSQVLQEKCVPVYCKYKFLDLPPHRTCGRKHGTHVYFKDVNVILTTTISPEILHEYLCGPPMEIEIHDRDRKLEVPTGKPSLFGTLPEDEKLGNVGTVTSKDTVHDPFTERGNLWDPYGVARVNLSDLLEGEKCLSITVPIHSCIIPDVTGNLPDKKSGNIMGVMGSVDGPQGSPLPMGHYLESDACLKIRVDLSVPLSSVLEAIECPFGRIIYIFENNNMPLLQDLMDEITEINASAFQLDSYPVHVIQKALVAFKLEDEQKESYYLDFITGFHIMDGQIHLFVLEGLKNKGIKRIWENLSTWNEDLNVKILYNSNLSFHQRLYKDLDAILFNVHLHQPLACIVKQPLLYIRDMVPPACFQALSRLHYICSAYKLKDVIREDLLPSAEMIALLSREFGIPLTTEKFLSQDVLPSDPSPLTPQVKESSFQSVNLQLDNSSEDYVQLKKNMLVYENRIKINNDKAFQMKKKIKPKINTIVDVPADGKPVHNYGFQTLNSSHLAMKLLRQKMAKEPRRRFAYNDYLSGTLDPVDLETELKACAAKSRSAWLTPQGFLYPGVKSSIESNQHPRKPHEARILDLTKKWKENILHGNIFKPMLNRGSWGWNQRHMDFDLYSKPPDIISVETSYSSHCTDDHLEDKCQKAEEREYMKWLDKIVVDDPRMTFYRCSIQGELTIKGAKASSQQKKLGGLLKDVPVKYSLREPILALKPIPPLAVLEHTEDTTKAFGPGQDQLHSLKWNGNIIPRHNMEHKKYEKLRGSDFKLF